MVGIRIIYQHGLHRLCRVANTWNWFRFGPMIIVMCMYVPKVNKKSAMIGKTYSVDDINCCVGNEYYYCVVHERRCWPGESEQNLRLPTFNLTN